METQEQLLSEITDNYEEMQKLEDTLAPEEADFNFMGTHR
jgi:hypothetical protein